MRRIDILALALLFLAPPAILPVRADAQAPDTSSGMALERASDGSYALPLRDAPPLRLEFEPAGSPVELVGLSWHPETGMLEATLTLTGDRPASAWAVEVATISTAGTSLGTGTLTQDWFAGGDDEASDRFGAKGFHRREHEEGVFHPYQVGRVKLGVSLPTEGSPLAADHVVLSTPLVIYADSSFSGSPALARKVLEARKVAAEELAVWSVRLDDAIAHVDAGPRAAAGVLETLRAVDAELTAPAKGLPASVQAVRRNLHDNLGPILRRADAHPEQTARALRDLASWVHEDLAARLKTVPAELPEVPGPRSDQGNASRPRSSRLAGKLVGETLNCDCGGETIANVTRTQTLVPNLADGWHVDEAWDFHCKSESGADLGASTGSLHGVGGAVDDGYLMCFDALLCPPIFTGPDISNDFENRYWTRTVSNQRVLFGVCTASCAHTTSASLTRTCLCQPRPQPGCSIDGCPVLVETGAGGFPLTDLAGGVSFDLDADGAADRVSWTPAGGDDAWLVLDRNGNGTIDDGSELFGDVTPQPPSDEPNGFLALAVFDRADQGGNGDGVISAADAIFPDLRLWLDRDHDGTAEPDELQPLAGAGIAAIELDYFASARSDRYGNRFRYATRVWLAGGGRRLATDVFLKKH